MEFPDIPKHNIIQPLGAGGMAHIYLADHTFLKTKVAVKVMAPDLYTDPAYAERFLREARIAAQLDHPNIVRVRDGGEIGNLHYLTMEYLDGGNLRDDMREGMSLAESIKVCKDIARALQYLATKNFVHRDIKPENVLLRQDKTPVLCDFGIAKEIEKRDPKYEELTAGPMMIGTLSYMSPEQAWGDPVDGRSDLYSLGVIFFEMLAGTVPLRGENRAEHREMLLSTPIPPLPADIAPLQPFVEKALAKHPDDRFQSGAEMIAALEELEEEEYDLIHSGRTTISLEDPTDVTRRSALSHLLTRLRGALSGQRKTANRKSNSSALRRIRSQKAMRRRRLAALGAVLAVVATAAVWLTLQEDGATRSTDLQRTPALDRDRDGLPAAGSFGNVEELLSKATAAIDDGRYYGHSGDDAETYLTNVLVLHPNHPGGVREIERLYGIYLEQAQAALGEADLPRSQELLRQTTLISDLIEDRELVSRSIDLRSELSALRKQQLIAGQRQRSIEKLLSDAAKLRSRGNATSPPGASAYDKYREALSLDPANSAAREGIMGIAGDMLELARKHLDKAEITTAQAYVNAAVQVYPQHTGIETLRKKIQSRQEQLTQQKIEAEIKNSEQEKARLAAVEAARRKTQDEIAALLQAAKLDIREGRLGTPRGNNAIEKYNAIVTLDPANAEAVAGFEAVAESYIELASDKIKAGDLKAAERQLISAQILSPTNPRFIQVQSALIDAKDRREREAAVERERQAQIATLLQGARTAEQKGNIYSPRGDNALEKLRDVLELDANNAQALKLRSALLGKIDTLARDNIGKRQLTQAKIAIAAMTANNAAPPAVAALHKLYDAEVARITAENQKAARDKAAREQEKRRRLAEQAAEKQRIANEKAAAARTEEEARIARELAEQQRIADEKAASARAAEKARAAAALAQKKKEQLAQQRALEEKARELATADRQQSAQGNETKGSTRSPTEESSAAVSSLLARAESLGRVRSSNYRELADIYSRVLQLQPANSVARAGMSRVAAQSEFLAEGLINARKFDAARSELTWLSSDVAASKQISTLKESLAYAERQSRQASDLLREADALTNTAYKKPGLFGSNDSALKTLSGALEKIAAARSIDPGNPAIAASESALVKRYGQIIDIHLRDKSHKEAREFLDALLQTGLKGGAITALGDRVTALEAEQETSSAPMAPTF